LKRFYAAQKFQKTGTEDFRRTMEAESGRSLERFFEQWIYGTEIPRVRYSTTIASGAVNVRFEQTAGVFDLPVTVTIAYADGRAEDVVVPVTETVVERTIATSGAVRQVQVNRDSAAVAEFTAGR
jgi:aminopeptidase N